MANDNDATPFVVIIRPIIIIVVIMQIRLRNDLYCVEWDVKLYYTIPYYYAN